MPLTGSLNRETGVYGRRIWCKSTQTMLNFSLNSDSAVVKLTRNALPCSCGKQVDTILIEVILFCVARHRFWAHEWRDAFLSPICDLASRTKFT